MNIVPGYMIIFHYNFHFFFSFLRFSLLMRFDRNIARYIAALFKVSCRLGLHGHAMCFVKQRLVFPLKDTSGSQVVSHRTQVVF